MHDLHKMDGAIEQWLAARANFHQRVGDYVNAYSDADLRLLEAFASDWNVDDPKMFGTVYQALRRALIASSQSADSDQQVTTGGMR